MKVILLQDIKGTGKKDQILEISDGYARNYLLPRKLAKEATAEAVNSLEKARGADRHREEVRRQEAEVKAREDLNFKWLDFTEEDDRSVDEILAEMQQESDGIAAAVEKLKSLLGGMEL